VGQTLVRWLYNKGLNFKIPFTDDTLQEADYIGLSMKMYAFAKICEIADLKYDLTDAIFTWGKTKPLHEILSCTMIVWMF
jgi:hypothetical protein